MGQCHRDVIFNCILSNSDEIEFILCEYFGLNGENVQCNCLGIHFNGFIAQQWAQKSGRTKIANFGGRPDLCH